MLKDVQDKGAIKSRVTYTELCRSCLFYPGKFWGGVGLGFECTLGAFGQHVSPSAPRTRTRAGEAQATADGLGAHVGG